MDIPKGFKPDGKDLDENMKRLLDEKSVKKTVEVKIEEALRDYIGERRHSNHIVPVPSLVKYIKQIENLGSYISNLTTNQIEGETPIVRILSLPEGLTPVTYDLYWDPEKDRLEFDWDDTPGSEKRLEEYVGKTDKKLTGYHKNIFFAK